MVCRNILLATIFVLLNRWALNIPIRTEHTTITRFWLDEFFTLGAFPKKLAGVHGHRFFQLISTIRTSDNRCGLNFHPFDPLIRRNLHNYAWIGQKMDFALFLPY